MNIKRLLLVTFFIIVLCFSLVGCDKYNSVNNEAQISNVSSPTVKPSTPDKQQTVKKTNKYSNIENNPIVTMEIEDIGVIKIKLYPEIAPTPV